jgi:hypothetical protein
MSVDQAQAFSSISRWTWRAKAYSGEIESIKVGARMLIPVSEIERVIREGRRPRADGQPAGAPSLRARHRSVTEGEGPAHA